MIPRVQMAPGGPEFSRLVQGYWRASEWGMTPAALLSFIETHLELGITTVDHAAIYGSPSCEQQFGAAMKLSPSLRERLEIVSKCGIVPGERGQAKHYDSSRQAIIDSAERSLRRLGTEYLDVLLLHRPDFLMSGDEVAEAFSRLKAEGKVRYFGTSNFSRSQFECLQSRLDKTLVTNQIEINPFHLDALENGDLDMLQQHRVLPMAWSCLSGGRLFKPANEKDNRISEALLSMAKELAADTLEEVVYAWILMLPSLPLPILGSRSIERVRIAAASLDLQMNREQWYRLLALFRGHDVP